MGRATGTLSVGVVTALAAWMLVWHKMRQPEIEDAVQKNVAVLAEPAATPEAVEQAQDALLHQGAPAVAALLRALQDGAGEPALVIEALARIGDPAAVSELRRVAVQHADPAARRAAVAALAEFEDLDARGLLFRIADADPALAVRQQAVVALADLGEDRVLADLAEILDPTTLPDLREAANDSLEVMTDQDFSLDKDAASAWLSGQEGIAPATSVGGRGREAAAQEALEGDGAAARFAGGAIEFELAADLLSAANLVLDLQSGSVVVEIGAGESGPVARCVDLPAQGEGCDRHAPVPVTVDGNVARFSIPRVGQLAAEVPRALTVVRGG